MGDVVPFRLPRPVIGSAALQSPCLHPSLSVQLHVRRNNRYDAFSTSSEEYAGDIVIQSVSML
jgi:hypothetical protein